MEGESVHGTRVAWCGARTTRAAAAAAAAARNARSDGGRRSTSAVGGQLQLVGRPAWGASEDEERAQGHSSSSAPSSSARTPSTAVVACRGTRSQQTCC
ncbi:hypothetical protein EON62_03205 [archaeon]|nr:MAG: hypothetical protein EON62_03205 [archaeon]